MTTYPPADYPGCPVTITEAVAEGRALRPPRWGLWDVVWAGIGTILLAALAGTIVIGSGLSEEAQVLLVLTVPWLAMGGWPLVVTAWRGNGPRLDLGLRLRWSDVGWAAVGAWVAFVGALVGYGITRIFVPDVTSNAAEVADQLTGAVDESRLAVTLFAFCVMVGAPVVEELYFRGLFFSALRKRGLGPIWTIVVTALVFTGFHFELTRVLILLPTGFALGWVRHRTGSTGASMLAHLLVNAPGALVLLVGIPQMSP